MRKVIFTVGLPSSGKTGWAKEQVGKGNGSVKRVNKDDLREMIDGGKYSKENEEAINKCLNAIIIGYLDVDTVDTVIVDGCNLQKHIDSTISHIEKHADPTEENVIFFEEEFFNTSPLQCVEWNKCRKGNLPEDVIWNMLTRYQKEGKFLEFNPIESGKKGWIGIDLDGTLAHYDGWQGIEHIGEPILRMMTILRQHMDKGDTIKIFTARAHGVEAIPHIRKWLIKHDLAGLEITNAKDFGMKLLYDDRCRQVIPNTGLVIDSINPPAPQPQTA